MKEANNKLKKCNFFLHPLSNLIGFKWEEENTIIFPCARSTCRWCRCRCHRTTGLHSWKCSPTHRRLRRSTCLSSPRPNCRTSWLMQTGRGGKKAGWIERKTFRMALRRESKYIAKRQPITEKKKMSSTNKASRKFLCSNQHSIAPNRIGHRGI